MEEIKPKEEIKKEETESEISGKIQRINGKFAPGVSGNPAGKPKGSISIITKIKNILQEVAKTSDGNKRERLETLARNIVFMAINEKDKDMIKMLVNYIDGMPKQPIEGNLEGNFIIKWQNDNEDINDSLSEKPISERDSSGQNPL